MDDLKRILDKKIERRLAGGKEDSPGVWMAASLFGLAGWGVAAPVALFTYIGTMFKSGWITLGFIVMGFTAGIINTVRWIKREIE